MHKSAVQQSDHNRTDNNNTENNQCVVEHLFPIRPNYFFEFFLQVFEPAGDPCKNILLLLSIFFALAAGFFGVCFCGCFFCLFLSSRFLLSLFSVSAIALQTSITLSLCAAYASGRTCSVCSSQSGPDCSAYSSWSHSCGACILCKPVLLSLS